MIKKFKWMLKQTLPFSYDSMYADKKGTYVVYWKMWCGYVFDFKCYQLVDIVDTHPNMKISIKENKQLSKVEISNIVNDIVVDYLRI